MSVVGNLSRHFNLVELSQPRQIPTYQSVAARQAEARLNLGLTTTGGLTVNKQPTPGVLNSTGTLTAAMMLSGIVTSTTAAAVTATLDTGALLEAAWLAIYPALAVNDAFEFAVVNTGANGFTIATASGWTDGGNAFTAVAAGTTGRFLVRRTAASAFTIYKVA